MKEDINLWREFEDTYKSLNVEMYQMDTWCNQGNVYHFRSKDDVIKVLSAFLERLAKLDADYPFKFQVFNNEEESAIEIDYPDED